MEVQKKENQLQVVSLSHKIAPISIRESFVFDEQKTKDFLLFIKDLLGIQEAILISTCNRTEVYYFDSIEPELVIQALASFKAKFSSDIRSYFSVLNKTEASVTHLLRVGIGLESQVLGDLQIINQVKNAYQWCADVQMAGPFLHKLLHSLFFANKRVVQETSFRSGAASLSYATKELAEELLIDKTQPICVLGLGEIGLATVRNIAENGFTNITVCNRTESAVLPLVEEFGIKYTPLQDWKKIVLKSKLIVSALSGDVLSIEKGDMENRQFSGFQYFIDLGLPRSISPEIESESGLILYNLDQIQSKVSAALDLRRSSIPQVENIVISAKEEFLDWTKEMQVSPIIHQMKNALEQIRIEEMGRFLKKVEGAGVQAEWADELTKNLMQRIIKNHVVQLKASCRRGDSEQLVGVLSQIFNIESSSEV